MEDLPWATRRNPDPRQEPLPPHQEVGSVHDRVHVALTLLAGRTSIPRTANLWNRFLGDADTSHGRSSIRIADDRPEKVGEYEDALPTFYQYYHWAASWERPGKYILHVQTDAGKDCLHVGVHPSRGVCYAGGEYESVNCEGGHIAPQQVYACSVGDTDDWRQQMVASHGSHRCRKCC